jgi:hypothetical protein
MSGFSRVIPWEREVSRAEYFSSDHPDEAVYSPYSFPVSVPSNRAWTFQTAIVIVRISGESPAEDALQLLKPKSIRTNTGSIPGELIFFIGRIIQKPPEPVPKLIDGALTRTVFPLNSGKLFQKLKFWNSRSCLYIRNWDAGCFGFFEKKTRIEAVPKGF